MKKAASGLRAAAFWARSCQVVYSFPHWESGKISALKLPGLGVSSGYQRLPVPAAGSGQDQVFLA